MECVWPVLMHDLDPSTPIPQQAREPAAGSHPRRATIVWRSQLGEHGVGPVPRKSGGQDR